MSTQKTPSSEHPDEEIAVVAYLIWEREGCPDGRDLDHWLEAKKQLAHGSTAGGQALKNTSFLAQDKKEKQSEVLRQREGRRFPGFAKNR